MTENENKRLVVDVDGVIAKKQPDKEYSELEPDAKVVSRLRAYRSNGFYIILNTARNMRTYDGRIGKINANTAPVLLDWLDEHAIPYDEIHFGKPWCGYDGFYIDDNAVRPSEFVGMSHESIQEMLTKESRRSAPNRDKS